MLHLFFSRGFTNGKFLVNVVFAYLFTLQYVKLYIELHPNQQNANVKVQGWLGFWFQVAGFAEEICVEAFAGSFGLVSVFFWGPSP